MVEPMDGSGGACRAAAGIATSVAKPQAQMRLYSSTNRHPSTSRKGGTGNQGKVATNRAYAEPTAVRNALRSMRCHTDGEITHNSTQPLPRHDEAGQTDNR